MEDDPIIAEEDIPPSLIPPIAVALEIVPPAEANALLNPHGRLWTVGEEQLVDEGLADAYNRRCSFNFPDVINVGVEIPLSNLFTLLFPFRFLHDIILVRTNDELRGNNLPQTTVGELVKFLGWRQSSQQLVRNRVA